MYRWLLFAVPGVAFLVIGIIIMLAPVVPKMENKPKNEIVLDAEKPTPKPAPRPVKEKPGSWMDDIWSMRLLQ